MDRVHNTTEDLDRYARTLFRETEDMEQNLKTLRAVFAALDWDDPVYDSAKATLNDHIKNMNGLLRGLSGVAQAAVALRISAQSYDDL